MDERPTIIWRVEDGKENCMETFVYWGEAVQYAKQHKYPEVWKYVVDDNGNEEVVACIWKDGEYIG